MIRQRLSIANETHPKEYSILIANRDRWGKVKEVMPISQQIFCDFLRYLQNGKRLLAKHVTILWLLISASYCTCLQVGICEFNI